MTLKRSPRGCTLSIYKRLLRLINCKCAQCTHIKLFIFEWVTIVAIPLVLHDVCGRPLLVNLVTYVTVIILTLQSLCTLIEQSL